jgi:proline iminopeptidase
MKKILFPEIKPYEEGYLKVSDLHKIHYQQYGNKNGVPIIWLHGGPGGGCSGQEARYFDPNFYRIILFDQRGAGKSQPFCELKENNTGELINDIEKLRLHLKIEKLAILGGSWGSLLALAYSIAHPDKVLALILRGVFTAREAEIYNFCYGMRDTFPEAWQEWHDFLPPHEQNDLAASYVKRILDSDHDVSLPAIKAFVKYDTICAYHQISDLIIEENLDNANEMIGLAKIFMHYYSNSFFLPSDYIRDNLHKITNLACIIIHGRYDMICRASVAYDLHKKWPNSILNIVPAGGHTAREEELSLALREATIKLQSIL